MPGQLQYESFDRSGVQVVAASTDQLGISDLRRDDMLAAFSQVLGHRVDVIVDAGALSEKCCPGDIPDERWHSGLNPVHVQGAFFMDRSVNLFTKYKGSNNGNNKSKSNK